jgi:hypothetical protein
MTALGSGQAYLARDQAAGPRALRADLHPGLPAGAARRPHRLLPQPGDPAFGTADPSDYYLASYVGVVIGALGLVVLPAHVAAYRERGVLRRLRASSMRSCRGPGR